jgi:hypothetical protein
MGVMKQASFLDGRVAIMPIPVQDLLRGAKLASFFTELAKFYDPGLALEQLG